MWIDVDRCRDDRDLCHGEERLILMKSSYCSGKIQKLFALVVKLFTEHMVQCVHRFVFAGKAGKIKIE